MVKLAESTFENMEWLQATVVPGSHYIAVALLKFPIFEGICVQEYSAKW